MSAERTSVQRGDPGLILMKGGLDMDGASPSLNPEFHTFPEFEVAASYMIDATAAAASAAAVHIEKFTGGVPDMSDLDKEELKRRTKILDKAVDAGFVSALQGADISIEFQDAEGTQEAASHKLGEAMPTAAGFHGRGGKRVSGAVDELEGSKKSAQGRPGAMSIAGLTTRGGLTPLPYRESDPSQKIEHVEKLFAPKAFKDLIHLERPTDDNLRAIMGQGVAPEDITWAVMERDCNAAMTQRAHELGVNLEFISSGDLEWGMRAMLSDPEHPVIMAGRGGAPEGVIAMILARALGATGFLREMQDSDADIETVKAGQIWTPKDFVPGAQEQSMVVFSAVTDNNLFDMRGIKPDQRNSGLHVVESRIISASGIDKRTSLVPIREYNF